MICFVDTETSRLVPKYVIKSPITYANEYPSILEISWILAYPDGEIYEVKNRLIKPNTKIILEPAIKNLTGIDETLLEEKGELLEIVAEEFNQTLKKSNMLVAHNMKYDFSVLLSNFYKHNIDVSLLNNISKLCTLQKTINICKLPHPRYSKQYKWPKLMELYKFLFNKEFNNAHRAASDVLALKECFFELKKRGLIQC